MLNSEAQATTNCYWCGTALTTANKSYEHIIPAALGGRTTNADLLCQACNNGPASALDRALADQVGYIIPLLAMAQPNPSPAIKMTGKLASGGEVAFRGNLEPETTLTIEWKNEPPYHFTRTEAEVRSKARRYLEQKKGQYPGLDPEKMLADAQHYQAPVEELVFFSNWTPQHSRTGGLDFYKGIIKIAVNYYLSQGGHLRFVQRPLAILQEENPRQNAAKFYYPTSQEVHPLGQDEVSNLLYLKADPVLGLLYCYVEIFNAHKVIVLLNDAYDGAAMERSYCYDLLNKQRLRKTVRLPIKFADHLLDHFVIQWDTAPLHDASYKRMRKIIETRLRHKGVVA